MSVIGHPRAPGRRLDGAPAEQGDQQVGGGVVADRDHVGGDRVRERIEYVELEGGA